MSGSKREKGGKRKGDIKRRGRKEAWTEGEGKRPKAERKAVEEEEGKRVQSRRGEVKTHAGQVMSKAGALGDQRPWSPRKLRMAPASRQQPEGEDAGGWVWGLRRSRTNRAVGNEHDLDWPGR